VYSRTARLTPQFCANRAVREYTEQHYIPAAATYRERAANKGAAGRQLVDWRQTLDRMWGTVRFGELRVDTTADHYLFQVEVYLNDIDPNAVRVELYADGINSGVPAREEMKCARPLPDASGCFVYQASIPATRSAEDYTVRVIPRRDDAAIPLEDARIAWQR